MCECKSVYEGARSFLAGQSYWEMQLEESKVSRASEHQAMIAGIRQGPPRGVPENIHSVSAIVRHRIGEDVSSLMAM